MFWVAVNSWQGCTAAASWKLGVERLEFLVIIYSSINLRTDWIY